MNWRRNWSGTLAAISLVLVLGNPTTAQAGQGDSPQDDEIEGLIEEIDGGLRHETRLQLRINPLGLSYRGDTAFRIPLWDSDNIVLHGAYFDGGITKALSPAYAWGGPYIEFLPLAVLNLRVATYFKGYFGTFGHLHVAEDGDWSRDARDRTSDEGLGQAATGWRLKVQATPQILIGRVAFSGETSLHRMEVDVADPYYEPSFGLLFEPQETFFVTSPTLGYIFGSDPSEWYLLLGIRWERTATHKSDVVRDNIGIVWNTPLSSWLMEWGDPVFAGFFGSRVNHPLRRLLSPYVGMQLTMEF